MWHWQFAEELVFRKRVQTLETEEQRLLGELEALRQTHLQQVEAKEGEIARLSAALQGEGEARRELEKSKRRLTQRVETLETGEKRLLAQLETLRQLSLQQVAAVSVQLRSAEERSSALEADVAAKDERLQAAASQVRELGRIIEEQARHLAVAQALRETATKTAETAVPTGAVGVQLDPAALAAVTAATVCEPWVDLLGAVLAQLGRQGILEGIFSFGGNGSPRSDGSPRASAGCDPGAAPLPQSWRASPRRQNHVHGEAMTRPHLTPMGSLSDEPMASRLRSFVHC